MPHVGEDRAEASLALHGVGHAGRELGERVDHEEAVGRDLAGDADGVVLERVDRAELRADLREELDAHAAEARLEVGVGQPRPLAEEGLVCIYM
jgi:hypothetical protein